MNHSESCLQPLRSRIVLPTLLMAGTLAAGLLGSSLSTLPGLPTVPALTLAPTPPTPCPLPPRLKGPDQVWEHLEPSFAAKVRTLMRTLAAEGRPVQLLEGYRSPERQAQLAAQGPAVTRASAYQSLHQWGLAADLVPLVEGRPCFDTRRVEVALTYERLGHHARILGLRWGGVWTLRDLGHVEAPLSRRSPRST